MISRYLAEQTSLTYQWRSYSAYRYDTHDKCSLYRVSNGRVRHNMVEAQIGHPGNTRVIFCLTFFTHQDISQLSAELVVFAIYINMGLGQKSVPIKY